MMKSEWEIVYFSNIIADYQDIRKIDLYLLSVHNS